MSVFSAGLNQKINCYLGRYETRRSAIIPILHAIQDECGWVQDSHVEALEKEYDLHRVQVREVLTFYTIFHKDQPAKHTILFCNNIVCCMLGANEVIEKIEKHVHAFEKKGVESPFSVEGVPCLGVCDGAPAMLVNKDRYLKVSAETVDQILERYAPLAK